MISRWQHVKYFLRGAGIVVTLPVWGPALAVYGIVKHVVVLPLYRLGREQVDPAFRAERDAIRAADPGPMDFGI